MQSRTRVAIVGYGNIGQYALEAVTAAPDMELVGVVRRPSGGAQPPELATVKVTTDIRELPGVTGALLCVPTRSVPKYADQILRYTVAVKALPGVRKALSITIPAGIGIHKRAVYVELAPGATFEAVELAIKTDPYFVKDETRVIQVEDVDQLIDMGHGVLMERRGGSGATDNQLFKFDMRVNNPALTAQVMVAALRAAHRQSSGCYTMIEIPVIDYLPGDRADLIRRLV